MDSEILDQLTNLGRDVDSEFPKPKRGRKKKVDTKINELEDNDDSEMLILNSPNQREVAKRKLTLK